MSKTLGALIVTVWLVLDLCLGLLTAWGADSVLLDFTADWCGPCKAMEPIVQRLEMSGVFVQRVNIDQNPQLAQQYGVKNIPCYIALKDSREVGRLVGATTEQSLRSILGTNQQPPTRWETWIEGGNHKADPNNPSVVLVMRTTPIQGGQWTRRADGNFEKPSSNDDIGSGVVIYHHPTADISFILTANHVISGGSGPIRIYAANAPYEYYTGRIEEQDAEDDWAVILTRKLPVPAIPLDIQEPAPGDELTILGYPNAGQQVTELRCRMLRYTTSSSGKAKWISTTGNVASGCSGGPILKNKMVVGTVWGSSGGTCSGTSCVRIRQRMGWKIPMPGTQINFNAQINPRPFTYAVPPKPQCDPSKCDPSKCDPSNCPKPTPTIPIPDPVPPTPVAQIPPAPAQTPTIPPVQMQIDLSKLADLIAARIPKPKDGLNGKDGKDGQPGANGTNGKDAVIDINAITEQVVSRLPKIRIQTTNPDGSVYQEAEARLGDLIILEPIPVRITSEGETNARGSEHRNPGSDTNRGKGEASNGSF